MKNKHCTSNPLVRKRWSASSLAKFDQCPRLYQLYDAGWESGERNIKIEAGDYLHRALGRFDTELLAWKGDVEKALYHALKHLFGIMGDWYWVAVCECCGDVEEGSIIPLENDPDNQDIHPACGSRAWMEQRWIPWITNDTKLNRWTLMRTLVWYADEVGAGTVQPLQLEGKDVTEVEWEVELEINSPDGDPYVLTGYFDGPVEVGSEKFVRERKVTTSAGGSWYFDLFDPHVQTDTYTLASEKLYDGEMSGILLEVIQIGVNFSRVTRKLLPKTKKQNWEWEGQIEEIVGEAKVLAEVYGEKPWPMKRANCNLFAGTTEESAKGCIFKGVCNKDPSQRERYLKAGFVKREER